jgi:alanine racemase
VIPIGIADGHRSLHRKARAEAVLRGRRVPIRGVSLEYIVLELDDFPDAEVGDEVTLLGERDGVEIGLGEFASWQAASPHEVLMGLEGRLPARYVGQD